MAPSARNLLNDMGKLYFSWELATITKDLVCTEILLINLAYQQVELIL